MNKSSLSIYTNTFETIYTPDRFSFGSVSVSGMMSDRQSLARSQLLSAVLKSNSSSSKTSPVSLIVKDLLEYQRDGSSLTNNSEIIKIAQNLNSRASSDSSLKSNNSGKESSKSNKSFTTVSRTNSDTSNSKRSSTTSSSGTGNESRISSTFTLSTTVKSARLISQYQNAKNTGVEKKILESSVPIEINKAEKQEEIEVLGYRGVLANKDEILNWRSDIPLSEYKINHDSNPEIIIKKPSNKMVYKQDVGVRFLKPPTPLLQVR